MGHLGAVRCQYSTQLQRRLTLAPVAPPRTHTAYSLQYIGYKARTVALPWNPAHGGVTEAGRKAIFDDVSKATGLSPEALGYKPAEEAGAEKK